MTNNNRQLCLCLLKAETEEDVVSILKQRNIWDKRDLWRPYGDIANNRGIVGNQQSSPVAALVEKLVNSIDAVLIAECLRKGIDPRGDDAPQTMQEAARVLLGIRDGKIQNVDPSLRTQYAERIRLVACGTKDQPGYLIIDDGEGQVPKDFPDTFLSLLRENKTAIPFVQGKFNMGGTGVLQFAGVNSFQLIISRRQPDLYPGKNADTNHWGFTLIRRLDPGPFQPQTMYVYLAPEGEILSFSADSMPLLPGRYPELFTGELEAGTCIKIWNYKFPGRLKSLATLDLRYALERHLQEPAIPIRIQERRNGYRAHSYDTTMAGLCSVIAADKDKIEPGFDTGGPMHVPSVGIVQLRLVVLKDVKDEGRSGSERYAGGVFFNVNGQLHSELGSDFISRRTKYDYIASDMIVIIDCTALPQRMREDLFLASRDRMRQCQERNALEDSIIDYLKDHPGLRDLNARRRQARLESHTTEDTSAVIKALIKADPTLASVFGKGSRIKVPGGHIPETESYEGKQFPTYFRLSHEPSNGMVKSCAINRTCRVEYETDASNDYFSRAIDPGNMAIRGAASRIGSVHLWNGKAILRFAPPTSSMVGDRFQIAIEVSDVSRVMPFVSAFAMEILSAADPGEHGPTPPPPGSYMIDLPSINEVYQADWAKHEFNEQSALMLKHGEEEGSIDVFINMDNIHLRNEIMRRRSFDPENIKYWFKYGLFLLAVGMLYRANMVRVGANGENRDAQVSDESEARLFGEIAVASLGMAVTIIPVILQLGKGRTEPCT